MPCLTVQFDPVHGPLITLGISPAHSVAQEPTAVRVLTQITALVDTGASLTSVTPEIAEKVGLTLLGKTPMMSASETTETNLYLADIAIPFGEPGQSAHGMVSDARVMEFQMDGGNFQMLLGRDILCRGLFQMVGYDKRFTFCL